MAELVEELDPVIRDGVSTTRRPMPASCLISWTRGLATGFGRITINGGAILRLSSCHTSGG